MQICRLLLGLLLTYALAHPLWAQAGNPMLDRLTIVGLELPDGERIKMVAPSITDGMTIQQQQAVITTIAEKTGVERFVKESNVSPFELSIESVKSESNSYQVQSVDVWFIAYGTLEDVEKKKLLEELGQTKMRAGKLPENIRELTEIELGSVAVKPGLQSDGTQIAYSYIQTSLMDRVHLSVVSSSQSNRSDESLCSATLLDVPLANQSGLHCRWAPIIEKEDGSVEMGEPVDYSSAAGYTRVTKLKDPAGALLVEMHALFVEPEGWFNGRNLLRSKLPPVVQDSVRTFRRKLSQ